MAGASAQATGIGPKKAVSCAMEYVRDVFQQPSLLLEEVEANGDSWYVTVSFPRRHTGAVDPLAGVPRSLFGQARPRPIEEEREFKQVEVRREDGSVAAVRVRRFE